MSLVNQVLCDLEKRGANALPGEASIRVVPVRSYRYRVLLTMLTVLAAVLMAALLWWNNPEPKHTPAATGMSVVQESAKLVVAPQAASHPEAVAGQKAPQQEDRQPGSAEAAGAAMHLSFELSTIPLPSSLRDKPNAAAEEQRPSMSSPTAENKMPPAAPVTAAAPAHEEGKVEKQIKQASVQQQADNEFRKASGLMQQGRINEALAGYEAALRLDAGHASARQALAGLLLQNKRNADAEHVLQDGLKHDPGHSGFAMLLARLQVERNDSELALETMLKTLPYAGQQAEYHAFIAALLQRLGRHREAVMHYQNALQLAPVSGIWLMGLGISLQAVQRNEEALDAFRRARESHTLNAELQSFVGQKIKELQSAEMR